MARTGRTFKGILGIIAVFLKPLLNLASPMIRTALTTALKNVYTKAKGTLNPFDDYLIEFVAQVLGINLE